MTGLTLEPCAGQRELTDPAFAGEWAEELAKMRGEAHLPPWCSYFARRDGVPVGTAGFKGPPGGNGWIEIGYLTFVPARGTGVATALAAELVKIAGAQQVSGVRAHTLPERNPSTRVLEVNGFAFAGDVVDPEDGPVWRWERAPHA